MNYKYLIKLNIVAVFNKLRMCSNSENLIIFVTFMKVYKYYFLLFNFTNESASYQHYINNVLFKYLNDFVQIYLNDVFIYNKICKKHIENVRKVFRKLIDVDLQMNIKKCKFYVQKISFLNVLLFIEDICINLSKIQIILV